MWPAFQPTNTLQYAVLRHSCSFFSFPMLAIKLSNKVPLWFLPLDILVTLWLVLLWRRWKLLRASTLFRVIDDVLPEHQFQHSEQILPLEGQVQKALVSGKTSELPVLGWGEVSVVLKLDLPSGSFAVKRLAAAFSDKQQLKSYLSVVFEYIQSLTDAGLKIFPTWQTTVLDSVSKSITIYIVQKLFDSKMMLDKFLHRATQVQARRCYELLAKHVVDVERKFGGKVGLDAQVSNWFVELDKDEVIGLQYFDVTTPLMRSEKGGKERIDVNVFLCTLPLPIRFAVRNFMLADVIDKFYDSRGILLDAAGNLIKERLAFSEAISVFNKQLRVPLTSEDVTKYYGGDKVTWGLIQRVRRADRFFQEWICGQVYPFLLPGEIKR